MYDVIVIGAGPAGFAAATQAAKLHFKTLVLAKEIATPDRFNVLEEKTLVKNLISQAEKNSAFLEIKKAEVRSLDKNITSFSAETGRGDTYYGKAVVIACGRAYILPGIPGMEKFKGGGINVGKIDRLDQFEGKTCGVYGSTEASLEALILLSKAAKRLYAINPSISYSAPAKLMEKILSVPGLQFMKTSEIAEVKGGKTLESARVINSSQADEWITLDELYVDVPAVSNDTFENMTAKTLDGFVKINSECETNIRGIFAAGAVTDSRASGSLASAGQGFSAATAKYLVQ